MTDRELLEKAAKAAGIAGLYKEEGGIFAGGILYNDELDCLRCWNPLEFDGEALRLLAQLNLSIRYEPEPDGAMVCVGAPWHEEFVDYWWNEWLLKDAAAATRRAIVRAAAAIHDAGSKA